MRFQCERNLGLLTPRVPGHVGQRDVNVKRAGHVAWKPRTLD